MEKRVVVTGLGSICGLGLSTNEIWQRSLNGDSGISEISYFDTSRIAVNFAGEVKDFEISPDILSPREISRYDRFIQFAMHATDEALSDASLKNHQDQINSKDIGCILGVGIGGLKMIEDTKQIIETKGPRRISPFFIPGIIPNMAPGLVSLKYGFQGVNYHVSSACASASHAITSACREIESGRQKIIISGGSESALCEIGLQGFISMKALSTNKESPQKASRPFDSGRDGFVMGEGAGILVLEELEHALNRNAKIYCEIVGHGLTSDAHHITAPHPEGEGAHRCMKMALESANIQPEEVDYINAHGTSTPLGDIAETEAIKNTFGTHARELSISSTKSMTGHLLGAAGGLESIFCIKAIEESKIPPTINLENQDPKCDLNYTPNKYINREINFALNNSFGFGGTNSSILFKKYRGK